MIRQYSPALARDARIFFYGTLDGNFPELPIVDMFQANAVFHPYSLFNYVEDLDMQAKGTAFVYDAPWAGPDRAAGLIEFARWKGIATRGTIFSLPDGVTERSSSRRGYSCPDTHELRTQVRSGPGASRLLGRPCRRPVLVRSGRKRESSSFSIGNLGRVARPSVESWVPMCATPLAIRLSWAWRSAVSIVSKSLAMKVRSIRLWNRAITGLTRTSVGWSNRWSDGVAAVRESVRFDPELAYGESFAPIPAEATRERRRIPVRGREISAGGSAAGVALLLPRSVSTRRGQAFSCFSACESVHPLQVPCQADQRPFSQSPRSVLADGNAGITVTSLMIRSPLLSCAGHGSPCPPASSGGVSPSPPDPHRQEAPVPAPAGSQPLVVRIAA